MHYKFKKLAILTVLSFTTTACGALDRLSNVGQAPELQPMDQHTAPDRGNSLGTQIPQRVPHTSEPNSLWRVGAKAFFRDQRASNAGDIVTVLINIADEASVDNTTTRTRTSNETSELNNLLGLEGTIATVLPPNFDPSAVTDFGSTSNNTGTGSMARSESITLTVAAIVTQILPNGNMVIQGRQEVRVNFEVRELWITGIIRPEDISSSNTVQHTQIAEARISYGGRGQLTDMQQARYGQQLYDILFPF
jgi:flagellar L-ring protein FlgH